MNSVFPFMNWEPGGSHLTGWYEDAVSQCVDGRPQYTSGTSQCVPPEARLFIDQLWFPKQPCGMGTGGPIGGMKNGGSQRLGYLQLVSSTQDCSLVGLLL